eukprot:11674023-Ditylum_brightwellii.AAC.1
MEKAIISRTRMYYKILKITSSKRTTHHVHRQLKGHIIMFEDDYPIVAGKLLDPTRMKDLLHTHFVGPDKRSIDFLMKEILGSSVIKARAYVIYQ